MNGELNQALQALLESLKDYNRALVLAKQDGDQLVSELIQKLEAGHCVCRKCEAELVCEHAEHEPHEESLCGNCA